MRYFVRTHDGQPHARFDVQTAHELSAEQVSRLVADGARVHPEPVKSPPTTREAWERRRAIRRGTLTPAELRPRLLATAPDPSDAEEDIAHDPHAEEADTELRAHEKDDPSDRH